METPGGRADTQSAMSGGRIAAARVLVAVACMAVLARVTGNLVATIGPGLAAALFIDLVVL